MGKQYDDDEIEIDLRAILLEWKKGWWMIAAALAAGVIVAVLFSKVVLSPVYRSSSMLYVLSKETTLTSLADLQMGTQLTQDYKVLVTSRPVLEEVAEELGLDMTYEDLRDGVSIDNPTDTRILTITWRKPWWTAFPRRHPPTSDPSWRWFPRRLWRRDRFRKSLRPPA